MAAFISYAREDVNAAERLYTDLKAAGANPWLDSRDLRAGQLWKPGIKDAISHCRYFVALLSSRSINKRGYVQKELRQAFDVLDEFSESEVFLIPVRLDDCQPSNHRLRDLHWVDLFPNWNVGVEKLLRTMDLESSRGRAKGTLELLKRIYVEANGDEAQMLDAIRGLQHRIDRDSPEITDEEWAYIKNACPGSIVDLLTTIFQRPKDDAVKTSSIRGGKNSSASRKGPKK
jgi:hypothetical protein